MDKIADSPAANGLSDTVTVNIEIVLKQVNQAVDITILNLDDTVDIPCQPWDRIKVRCHGTRYHVGNPSTLKAACDGREDIEFFAHAASLMMPMTAQHTQFHLKEQEALGTKGWD